MVRGYYMAIHVGNEQNNHYPKQFYVGLRRKFVFLSVKTKAYPIWKISSYPQENTGR